MHPTPYLQILLACGAVYLATLVDARILTAQQPSDPRLKVVEVNGTGIDFESAKRDACREAVRQVVGAYVVSKTETENDQLIEDEVLTLSAGFVASAKTLQEAHVDGLARVRIRAVVKTTEILDSLRKHNVAITTVDGESLAAKSQTMKDQRQAVSELISAAFDGFPSQWFKASIQGEPRLGDPAAGDQVRVIVTVLIEPNVEAFTAAAAKLDIALKATERPHGEFLVDENRCPCDQYSPDQATRFLRSDINSDDRLDRPVEATPLSCLDGDKAFPKELVYFSNAAAGGSLQTIVPDGFLPVMFPVTFQGEGKRSTWKWYGTSYPEASAYFARHSLAKVRCRTTIIDREGNEIAMDTWELAGLGVGGAKHLKAEDAALHGHHTLAIAPAVIPRQGINRMFMRFACERTLTFTEDELRSVGKVSTQLE